MKLNLSFSEIFDKLKNDQSIQRTKWWNKVMTLIEKKINDFCNEKTKREAIEYIRNFSRNLIYTNIVKNTLKSENSKKSLLGMISLNIEEFHAKFVYIYPFVNSRSKEKSS